MEMLLSAIANTLSLCWIIIFLHVVGALTFTQGFDKTTTPLEQRGKLDGKNLKVILGSGAIAVPVGRGKAFRIIDVEDTYEDTLIWLSQRLNFTYTFRQMKGALMDPTSTSPGILSYLSNGETDIVMSAIVLTHKRFRFVDFTHPWLTDPIVLVISNPLLIINFGALWQPFQYEVWILLALSPVIVIAVLRWLGTFTSNSDNRDRLLHQFDYVVGTLLNQGGNCSSRRLRFRFVNGAWCLATFVFVNVYSCTLISHLFAPKFYPLIRTIHDLVDQENIHVVVKKGYGIDALISTADAGLLKHLGEKIRNYPLSRCETERDCLNLVKLGSHVYINVEITTFSAIREDYAENQRCEFAVLKESGWSAHQSFALPKNGSFIREINQGLLTMHQFGIIDKWLGRYKPKFEKCPVKLGEERKGRKAPEARLTIQNLMGAFIVLCVGCSMSIVSFVVENVVVQLDRRRQCTHFTNNTQPTRSVKIRSHSCSAPEIMDEQ